MASTTRSAGRRHVASALIAIPVAVVIAAAAMIALPVGQRTNGETATPEAPLVGEHSALGARQVAGLNAAIASMQQPRGEHAGLSRIDYEAQSALDGSGD